MCGIVGILGPAPAGPTLQRMMQALNHRGPDGTDAVFRPGRCALGHVRLAIVDLEGGAQPLTNERGTILLVANGEIYNHKALRRELEDRGHNFATGSDSEVILHLYEEYGPDCVRRLDGMFAFALWSPERGLFLGRDPLGIKPLYMGSDKHGNLCFASEIKALIGTVEQISTLPPGSCWIEGEGLRTYWQVPEQRPVITDLTQAVDLLDIALTAAVRKRLMADVPVGLFLSGGLDSSLIAAIARRETRGPLHSFAVGLEGSEDLVMARRVALSLGTVHHERVLTPAEVIAALPRVIQSLESCDPALVRSAIPTWFVSQMAARQVKVVLSGEGADELFAGYQYLADLVPDPATLAAELRLITVRLHNSNLQRVDRMTMAHGLEGRVPFLDVAMVDLASRISPTLKWRDGEGKWALRRMAARYLPSDVVWRPKAKFAMGTGIGPLLEAHAADALSNCEVPSGWSPEERLYWLHFQEPYGRPDVIAGMGRSRSLNPHQRWQSRVG